MPLASRSDWAWWDAWKCWGATQRFDGISVIVADNQILDEGIHEINDYEYARFILGYDPENIQCSIRKRDGLYGEAK